MPLFFQKNKPIGPHTHRVASPDGESIKHSALSGPALPSCFCRSTSATTSGLLVLIARRTIAASLLYRLGLDALVRRVTRQYTLLDLVAKQGLDVGEQFQLINTDQGNRVTFLTGTSSSASNRISSTDVRLVWNTPSPNSHTRSFVAVGEISGVWYWSATIAAAVVVEFAADVDPPCVRAVLPSHPHRLRSCVLLLSTWFVSQTTAKTSRRCIQVHYLFSAN